MLQSNEAPQGVVSKIIFENDNFALRYCGPDPVGNERVVISFPDLIHPTGFDAAGWGESFFRKRNQPAIFVLFKKANWYQSPGFFEAMKAAREFVGKTAKLTAYGSSMGAYGAILAAKTLGADHVLALCPQYTIQQDIAPFERRYRKQAQEIGIFIHDIDETLDHGINYVIVYDPTHNADRSHEALFRHPPKWQRVPVPGCAHGVLSSIFEMVSKGDFLDLVLNKISPKKFRRKIRNGRLASPRYIRRLGNLTLDNHHGFTSHFIDLARERSYFRLVKKWQGVLRNEVTKLPNIILHPGAPKTGTSAVQRYFWLSNEEYAKIHIDYPLDGADPQEHSHSKLSLGLRIGDLSALKQRLKHTPPTTKTLILSDESLFVEAPLFSEETRLEISSLLAPYKVKIVFCQRSLAAWKKSFYLQALKNKHAANPQGGNRLWGSNLTYRKFFEDEHARHLTDFKKCLDGLGDIFAAKETEIVELKPGQDIVPEFCRAAGLRYFEDMPTGLVNPSMQDVDGEIQRQANGFAPQHAGFIKRIIGFLPEFDATQLRENRLRNLDRKSVDLPWQKFAFKTNAPLKYTKAAFNARIKELKNLTEQISVAAADL